MTWARVGLLVLLGTACGGDKPSPAPDASTARDAATEAGATEATCSDGRDDDGDGDVDCDDRDCTLDRACAFSCGAFTTPPDGWSVGPGLRAVVVADASDGLVEPVGLAFAGRDYGRRLFVSDAGARAVLVVEPNTGITSIFASSAAFGSPPAILTAIVWDADRTFDGALYITDSVTDGDQDAVIHRIDATGAATVFARAPGPGLDSIYAMAFGPRATAWEGLYVAGDTDGGGPDWGRFDASGNGTAFSDVAGVEGIAFDASGRYGGGLVAARPEGGGYAGDGSLTPIGAGGVALAPIATGLGGVHANVLAPPGLFDGEMVAASWSSDSVFRVSPAGVLTTLATGLDLTNYDANILAVSPDGRALFVADRQHARIVCLEAE